MSGQGRPIKSIAIHMTSVNHPEALDLVEAFRQQDAARHDGAARPRATITALLIKAGYEAYQQRFSNLNT